MESTRTAKLLMAALFVAIIAIEGPVQAVLDWRSEGRPKVLDLFTQAPTQANLREFENSLEDSSWTAKGTRPGMQYLRYAALGDLGAKALVGRDDWLFYRPGVDFLIQPWDRATLRYPDDPMEAITEFRDALSARDIALLLVIVPGKASVYPDQLSGRGGGAAEDVQGHVRSFMAALDGAAVPYVNLHDIFAATRGKAYVGALYLARDTHWSPEGARHAAAAVADRILETGWVLPGVTEYRVQTAEVLREGDVLSMTDSPYIQAAYPPERVEATQVLAPEGTPYEDDPNSPVLVLGDSFLRIYQADAPGAAGFIAHLARELRQPLASIVSDGGASTLVRQELARKPELLAGKKLIVWEFVERDLRFGMEGWLRVALSG